MERKSSTNENVQVVKLLSDIEGGSGSAGTDRSITATTTSQQLMAANAARKRIYVANDSTIDVWIRPGGAASAAAGGGNVKVAANGGFFELAGTTEAWFIIAASGTPAISAREF